MKSFEDIFQARGSAYDRAMQRFPEARAMEFAQVVQAAQPRPGDVVADVPAGGNYLRRYLPRFCQWVGHEPCATFTQHDTAGSRESVPLLPLPWAEHSLDAAISLAGLHHLSDKTALFQALHQAVRPGGRLVLSDVAEHSPVAHFLDEFVGAHNSTGHEGAYLSASTVEVLRATGWVVDRAEMQHFHWRFATRTDMAAFCHGLFDLRHCSLDDTEAAIEKRLGVTALPGGGVGMAWSLFTIAGHKPVLPA